jgi:hypothetical protein
MPAQSTIGNPALHRMTLKHGETCSWAVTTMRRYEMFISLHTSRLNSAQWFVLALWKMADYYDSVNRGYPCVQYMFFCLQANIGDGVELRLRPWR